VVRATAGKEGVACYHSSLRLADIERMEIDTVTEDLSLGREIESKRRSNRRVYWRHMNQIIGASRGQETEYIYVEYHSTGAVHGRPMTASELKSKGARL
jgi:hypothetical protein